MRRIFFLLPVALICNFCSNPDQSKSTESNSKTSVITSKDTAKLGKLIKLNKFRPIKVIFRYSSTNNSAQNDFLSVPGPSDSSLDAILYFDSLTFKTIKEKYTQSVSNDQRYTKEQFNFYWMNKAVKQELLQDSSTKFGRPDLLFSSGPNARIWLLKNKVLLTRSTY